MAAKSSAKPAGNAAPRIESFADHEIITPPNRLRSAVRKVAESSDDDPIKRAEKALKDLSGEFRSWMAIECERLAKAYTAVIAGGYTPANIDALFRAAHDLKGEAATLGFPTAGVAAESLCRIIEHAPDLKAVPFDLIAHHVGAIKAIVREQHMIFASETAEEVASRLRKIADDYLLRANKERPEHLAAIAAPSLVPDLKP